MTSSRWSSPILLPVTTLDLHGKVVEYAIADVTLFLERIRTYHHHAAASTVGVATTCFVQIITGSGSHSSHGPILRSAVQKLLDKRRMVWKLEHGGGSFQVDALSGDDLYDPGLATDSKVLVAEEEDFHQLASSRRGYVAGSYATIAAQVGQSSVAQCTTSDSVPPLVTLSTYIEFPLPVQVLNDDKDVQTATRKSVEESQQYQRQLKQNECDIQRALSASRLEDAARERSKFESKVEEEHVLQQSIIDEQRRKKLADFILEEDLRLAMERSVGDVKKSMDAENDLIQQALAESLVLAEIEKAIHAVEIVDEDLLEKAFVESLVMEEETRKRNLHEHEQIAKSNGVDLFKEYAEDDSSNREDVIQLFEKSVHIG